MLLISDLASIELMSGFQVPGVCVMPSTSSSLAKAGAANVESVRAIKNRRRIMSTNVASTDAGGNGLGARPSSGASCFQARTPVWPQMSAGDEACLDGILVNIVLGGGKVCLASDEAVPVFSLPEWSAALELLVGLSSSNVLGIEVREIVSRVPALVTHALTLSLQTKTRHWSGAPPAMRLPPHHRARRGRAAAVVGRPL